MYHAQTFVGDTHRNTTYNMYLPQNNLANQNNKGTTLQPNFLRVPGKPSPKQPAAECLAVADSDDQRLFRFAKPLGVTRNADAPTALEAQNRRAPILAHVRPQPRPCGSLRHQTACLHKAANRPRAMVCHCLAAHVLLEVFVDAPSLFRRL